MLAAIRRRDWSIRIAISSHRWKSCFDQKFRDDV